MCGLQKAAEWTGGALSTQSQILLTISGFRGVKTRILCIRIRDIAKFEVLTERGDVEKSKLASASKFRQIEFREPRERVA